MADRFPLILNTSANQIQEIASGDQLDLSGNNIANAGIITATTFVGAVTGNATGLTGNPSINITDLDVDGHTNLDNVSVSGVSTFAGNADFSSGIDVTGNITGTGNISVADIVTISGIAPALIFTETNGDPDFKIQGNAGALRFTDTTNNAERLKINPDGHVDVAGNLDVGAGIDVTGNATVSGNLSVGGVLTYEDVTNVDSVGLITARNGITVSSGTATFQGAIDANGDLDVDGHTNLDNVSIAGVVTATSFVGALTGNATSSDTVDITNSSSSGTTFFLTFVDNNGSGKTLNLDSGLTYVPATNVLTSGTFSGNLTGNVTGNATSADTVDISGAGNANTEFYVTFSDTNGAAKTIKIDDGLRYNASSNILTASYFSGNGANLTGLNGSNIASGTVPVARIGTGTKNSSTFYRGDGTFATVTAPAITAINNATNNYVVTSDGGTTVTAESNLQFDGTHLSLGIAPGQHYYDRGIAVHTGGTGSVLHLTDGTSGSGQDNGLDIISHAGNAYIWQRETANIIFGVGGNTKWNMDNDGRFFPNGNNTQDIGKPTNRVRNIYTGDLHLSNKGMGNINCIDANTVGIASTAVGNSVDNTWGDWTIQEGENDLFILNNRNGKKYKFNLTEVS